MSATNSQAGTLLQRATAKAALLGMLLTLFGLSQPAAAATIMPDASTVAQATQQNATIIDLVDGEGWLSIIRFLPAAVRPHLS